MGLTEIETTARPAVKDLPLCWYCQRPAIFFVADCDDRREPLCLEHASTDLEHQRAQWLADTEDAQQELGIQLEDWRDQRGTVDAEDGNDYDAITFEESEDFGLLIQTRLVWRDDEMGGRVDWATPVACTDRDAYRRKTGENYIGIDRAILLWKRDAAAVKDLVSQIEDDWAEVDPYTPEEHAWASQQGRAYR